MIEKDLEKINESIAVLEELGLPISVDKLKEREDVEKKYLTEILLPQIQSKIQTLLEPLHTPFCLVVDYQHGTPVQIKIAEKTKLKIDSNRGSIKKVSPPKSKFPDLYESTQMKTDWKKYVESLPKGNNYVQFTISQSFHSLSKLLRVLQAKDMVRYIKPFFEMHNLPNTGRISPSEFISLLEPEQFVHETTPEGDIDKIVLWRQSQKVETKYDGTRIKVFEVDGVTPVMVDKAKKIREGQWSLKILHELMVQKKYFANLHTKDIINDMS